VGRDSLNLVKLCVGTDTVEELAAWQARRARALPGGLPRHVTRMWPRRQAELLDGGSLYWVFRGLILARQRILRLEEVIGEDGVRRCGIVLDPELVRTEPVPRRAFQGWRYLPAEEAPRDLAAPQAGESALPAELERALSEIGVR
jgi:hypothetical protein